MKNPETCVRLSNALPLNVGPHSGIRKNDVFLPYILWKLCIFEFIQRMSMWPNIYTKRCIFFNVFHWCETTNLVLTLNLNVETCCHEENFARNWQEYLPPTINTPVARTSCKLYSSIEVQYPLNWFCIR